MSLRSSALLLLVGLSLAACGFEPLYAKKTTEQPESKLLAGVHIDTISGRIGQVFKSSLEDRLNPSGNRQRPLFRLTTQINHVNVPISVARDGTVARYNIHLNSAYVLYRVSDDQPVTSGNLNYIVSYNNLTNVYFSTYVSEQDALKRGTVALAELYRQRLAAYLDQGAPQQEIIEMPKPGGPIDPNSLLRQKQGSTINFQ
ncbi:MAG: hypothetical protein K2Q01_04605 [Rickettsiales bacterium]|nr:hypothetical protein [Rickettsiales bacterium]